MWLKQPKVYRKNWKSLPKKSAIAKMFLKSYQIKRNLITQVLYNLLLNVKKIKQENKAAWKSRSWMKNFAGLAKFFHT